MVTIHLLVAIIPWVGAEPIVVGWKTGVFSHTAFSQTEFDRKLPNHGRWRDASKRFTFGPMIEVSLPMKLSLEADGLFRRTGFDDLIYIPSVSGTSVWTDRHVRADQWEIPVLLKYNFRKVFFGGGVAHQRLTNIKMNQTGCGRSLFQPDWVCHDRSNEAVVELKHLSANGPAATVGTRVGLGPLNLLFEVRYVFWNPRTFDFGTDAYGGLFSRRNQVTFLVSITVGGH